MIHLQAYAAAQLGELADQALFRTLAADPAPARSLQMLRHLTFWSNTFQDITRLNLARVSDPELRKIVQTHQAEDAGHDAWFNDDLRLAFGGLPDVEAVFDSAYLPAREVCYELMSEVFLAASDLERVALPIALEEGGKVFLPRMIAHFGRVGLGSALSALGTKHAEGEAAHTLHNDDEALRTLHLSPHARERAMQMVDRVTAAFRRFAQILDRAVGEPTPEEAAVAERLRELTGLRGQPRAADAAVSAIR
jgi:hypothetical protein